jgi:hypothetical protein
MSLTIRKILEQVENGTIRVPAFQRGFVWDAERVAYLMDSIYKGYPFGALILWRTKEKLNHERELGPFTLPDVQPEYPIDYVLDGQQRLTSIFGVFQTDLTPSEDAPWTKVYFDMSAESDLQESQFVCPETDDVDPAKHFPIGTFFDVTAYRQATAQLSAERAELIDKVQSVFKEATIPTQEVATEDRAKVAIVFERVNRLGVELDTFSCFQRGLGAKTSTSKRGSEAWQRKLPRTASVTFPKTRTSSFAVVRPSLPEMHLRRL